ncbi:MAG: hypothetical protein JWM11_4057 [Planctomycetaceae bacterium]|nr:hypothetical protein [Planctomycetaceae bacterium]
MPIIETIQEPFDRPYTCVQYSDMALTDSDRRDETFSDADALLYSGRLTEARMAYQMNGFDIPEQKLIAAAHHFLEIGWLSAAQQTYQATGMPIPRDTLISYGDRFLNDGDVWHAFLCFGAADAKDKLESVASLAETTSNIARHRLCLSLTLQKLATL